MQSLISAIINLSLVLSWFYLRGANGLISLLISFVLGLAAGHSLTYKLHVKPNVHHFSHVCSSILTLSAIILLIAKEDSWSLDCALGAAIFLSVVLGQALKMQLQKMTKSAEESEQPETLTQSGKTPNPSGKS